MRRIISFILTATLAAGALFGCAAHVETDTAVSASDPAREYLDTRMEDSSHIVTGTAEDAAALGIDMSGFREDGYIIRSGGEQVFIFGKTDVGLDRGVRRYAAALQFGGETDVTYGEGAYIKAFTVCGNDLSRYVITVTEAHPEGSHPESTAYAASELQYFIKESAGVTLPIVEETELLPDSLCFRLTCDGSGANGNEGFTVTVTEEGDVEILGGLHSGCLFGVYDICEEWFGVRFVTEDYTNYYEINSVEITTEDSYSEAPGIDFRYPYTATNTGIFKSSDFMIRNKNNGQAGSAIYGYGQKGTANHGMAQFWGNTPSEPNLCMNSEDVYETVIENLDIHLDVAEEGGSLYRGNYYHVNLGLNDTHVYCCCEECLDMAQKTGAQTESYARFIKRVADNYAETHPRVQFFILAYNGTEKPAETVLPDNVTVTYCITSPCYCGPMDGSDCKEGRLNDNNYTAETITEYILGWKEVTNNLNLWVYYFTYTINIPKNLLTHLYDDFRYFRDVLEIDTGIFAECEESTFAYDTAGSWLMARLMWDPDMSREEYDALVEEIMYLVYGNGCRYLLEYVDMYDSFIHCADSVVWGGAVIDYSYFAAHGDCILYLFDEARSLAETERERHNVDLLAAHVIANIMTGTYRQMYLNGTEEMRAEYEALAARLKEIFDASGATHISFMREVHIDSIDFTADPYTWLLHR